MAKVTRLIPKLIKFEDIHKGVGSSYRTATAAYFRNRAVKAIYWPVEVETDNGFLDYVVEITNTPGTFGGDGRVNITLEKNGKLIHSGSAAIDTSLPEDHTGVSFKNTDIFDSLFLKMIHPTYGVTIAQGSVDFKFDVTNKRFEGKFTSSVTLSRSMENEDGEKFEEPEQFNE